MRVGQTHLHGMGHGRADDEVKGNQEAARKDQGGVPRDQSPDERKLHQVPWLGDQGDVQAVPSSYHLDLSREHRGLRDERVCDANQDECDHKVLGHHVGPLVLVRRRGVQAGEVQGARFVFHGLCFGYTPFGNGISILFVFKLSESLEIVPQL